MLAYETTARSIRCFSELLSWVDGEEEELHNSKSTTRVASFQGVAMTMQYRKRLLSHTLKHLKNSHLESQLLRIKITKACQSVFIKSFRTRLRARLKRFIYQRMSWRDFSDLYAHILITFQHATALHQKCWG
jgi:hypothetical protein